MCKGTNLWVGKHATLLGAALSPEGPHPASATDGKVLGTYRLSPTSSQRLPTGGKEEKPFCM